MYVTTNLPVTKKWSGIVVFVSLDPAKPRIRVISLSLSLSVLSQSAHVTYICDSTADARTPSNGNDQNFEDRGWRIGEL